MTDEPPPGRFEPPSQERVNEAWRRRKDLSSGEEDAFLIYCMEHHSEWKSVWDSLGNPGAPVEIEGPDGPMNPVLHVQIDAIVKRQIESSNPREVRQTYDMLTSSGAGEFEAIHTIGRACIEELWLIMKNQRPYDEDKYVSKVRQYAREELRRIQKRRRG